LQTLLDAAKAALNDVTDTLGPPGSASPQNVSAAARVLGEYAVEFRRVEQQAQDLARDIEDEIVVLSRP
jgi:hypothetical protein